MGQMFGWMKLKIVMQKYFSWKLKNFKLFKVQSLKFFENSADTLANNHPTKNPYFQQYRPNSS